MRCATSLPQATPASSARPSGTLASDDASAASSVACWVGNRPTSTSCAAVAAAASVEAHRAVC
jgi:hypothetical protein